MSSLPVMSSSLSEDEYEAIAAAVTETARGRWFLSEYARRNRNADTNTLLTALDRIEGVIRGERNIEAVDRFRFDLVNMAKAIARTKAEIAAIKPDAEHHGKIGVATEELDSIVLTTETATSEILAAAEQIQETAWTLREHGIDGAICDLVDARATDIYTACSFQDLTGQRTRKVIQVLRYLEGRINAMIDIWGLDGANSTSAPQSQGGGDSDRALLNGPARPGDGLDQSDIDMVMGPATRVRAPRSERQRSGPTIEHAASPPEPLPEPLPEPSATHSFVAASPVAPQEIGPAPAAEPPVEALLAAELSPPLAVPKNAAEAARAIDAVLDPIMALSDDERLALFA